MAMSNERIEAELEDLRTLIGTNDIANKRADTDTRDVTDRALKTARDQAAADLDAYSAKLADLAVTTADHIRNAASDLEGQAADFHDTCSARVNQLQARVDVDISKAKQEFQDQREECQKHAYSQREDLEARIDADIHALTQRVHRAESLPPISDAQDILEQAADVKNTCDDNRKAFEEDFSRLQARLQTNIASLTKRVRELESGPAPWDTTSIERKQGNHRLRLEALERTANAHPDNEHEAFRNDFTRVDERLYKLENLLIFTVAAEFPSAHREHEVRIQSLERRADAGPTGPAADLDDAIRTLMNRLLDAQNLKYLREHPAWFPGFSTKEKARPEPPA